MNQRAKTTVSIVIPVYNMDWCLERAVESCLKQTWPVQEIIIVDDGSSDRTAKVIQKIASKHQRVKAISLSKNCGCAAALQTGIKAAKSEWIAFLDADDQLTFDSIQLRVVAALQSKDRKLGLVYGHVYVWKRNNEILVKNKLLKGAVYPYLCKELSLCQQITMLVKREIFNQIKYPTQSLPSSTDDDMLLTIAQQYHLLGIDAPVARIYLHDSQSRMTNNLYNVAVGTRLLVEKYKSDILKYHGSKCLLMWRLRIVRRLIQADIQNGVTNSLKLLSEKMGFPINMGALGCYFVLKYSLKSIHAVLHWYTEGYFEIHWL